MISNLEQAWNDDDDAGRQPGAGKKSVTAIVNEAISGILPKICDTNSASWERTFL